MSGPGASGAVAQDRVGIAYTLAGVTKTYQRGRATSARCGA